MKAAIRPLALFLVLTTKAAAVIWPQNLVSRATAEGDSPDPDRLADVSVKTAPVFAATISQSPAILELSWDAPVVVDMLALRWRIRPSDYTVRAKTPDGWQDVATVRNGSGEREGIDFRLLERQEANGFRIVIRGGHPDANACALDAVEIYDTTDLPPPIADFIASAGPRLFGSPAKAKELRSERNGDRLDQDLLVEEIPVWVPITSDQYRNQDTGRRVNELNSKRIMMAREASRLFHETGRREYAAKAWEVLWTTMDHYDRHRAFRITGNTDWSTTRFQEPGYHIIEDMGSYDLISEALTTEQRLRVLYYLLDLGNYQYVAVRDRVGPPGTIRDPGQIWNTIPPSIGALALLSWYLGSFPEAPSWMAECDLKIRTYLSPHAFLEDGSWWECSPSHHYYALQGFFRYALAKQLYEEPIWDRDFDGLHFAGTVEVFAKTANPLGEWPAVNETRGHGERIAGHPELNQLATLMDRGDWLHAWKGRPSFPDCPSLERRDIALREPAYRSVLLPDTGWAVIRDGWKREDSYLLLDYGPHGGGHGNHDKLNIILVADGRHWLPDAGISPHYNIFPQRFTWHRLTIAHNTVMIDRQNQPPGSGRLIRWHSDRDLDLVTAEFHDAYDPGSLVSNPNGAFREGPSVRHRRTVLHPRGGYFLIHDTIELLDGKVHHLDALYHVYGELRRQEPGRLVFEGDGKFLSILSPDITKEQIPMEKGLCGGLEAEKHKGDGYPEMGGPGWIYIPFFRLQKALWPNRPRVHYWVVVIPDSAEWKPEFVRLLGADEEGRAVEVGGPDRKDIVVEPGSRAPGPYTFDRVVGDADLVFVQTRNGEAQASLSFGGRGSRWDGKDIPTAK